MTPHTINRRFLTIAGLAAVATARTAVAQPATPASPVAIAEALYTVDLAAATLPTAPVAFGAGGVTMDAGTVVAYPEGSAGQSVAIDHVLSGGYEIETDSELIHIDRTGKQTEVDSGQTTTVAEGETIVLFHNEAEQRITAGDRETRTVTVALFSLERGTNENVVEGTLEQVVLGGTIVDSLPEAGVTVTMVPSEQASAYPDPVAAVPFMLESGEKWTAVVVPLEMD